MSFLNNRKCNVSLHYALFNDVESLKQAPYGIQYWRTIMRKMGECIVNINEFNEFD